MPDKIYINYSCNAIIALEKDYFMINIFFYLDTSYYVILTLEFYYSQFKTQVQI